MNIFKPLKEIYKKIPLYIIPYQIVVSKRFWQNYYFLKETENWSTEQIYSWQFEKLKKAFKGLDVYIYIKSEDQQWYRKEFHGTKSIHWTEICRHPWMSMTIKSNAEVVMCMEDYNNEIILGDTREETLYDIWNGNRYEIFRKDHFNLTKGIKCTEQCDMKLIGNLFNI